MLTVLFVHGLGRKINNGVCEMNEYLDNIKPLAFVTWLNCVVFYFSGSTLSPVFLYVLVGELLFFISLSLISCPWGGGASWLLTKELWTLFPPKPTWVTLIGEGGYSWAVSRYYFWKSRLSLQILQLPLLGLEVKRIEH